MPSSRTGLSALLRGAGERAPDDALNLAAVASGAGLAESRLQVDLFGIWAQSADMAAARSTTLMRSLDAKGRLQLPVDAGAATKLPAERDGAPVTVYLPGSSERPRPNHATAALPLDARGRLTMTAGVRRQAGIPDGADVLAVVDPDRRTVTLTAASRLSAGVTALLDGLRRPAADAPTATPTPPTCPASRRRLALRPAWTSGRTPTRTSTSRSTSRRELGPARHSSSRIHTTRLPCRAARTSRRAAGCGHAAWLRCAQAGPGTPVR
ncbi:hypothetical protein ACI799_01470 [Blastococcus sp. SYSU DS0753]